MSNKQKSDIVFGVHSVTALLEQQPEHILELWLQQGRHDQPIQHIEQLANDQGIALRWVDKGSINQRVNGNHQGVLAWRKALPALGDNDLPALLDNIEGTPLIVVLDGVTDPHNLGACLRTAEAAGAHLIIAPKDKSAPLNATSAKVACGAADLVPYVRVTNLVRTLNALQERGIWVGGTAGEASQSLYQQDLTGALAWVMGAEGKGMRRLTREHCDFLVNIPMSGAVSSVNVSVATGICLFETVRQRLTR